MGDALVLSNGRAFKPAEWTASGLPIVRIQNLNNPEALFNFFSGTLPERFRLADGDLLFAWSGTPGTSFGAHIWQGGQAWLNQHIFKVEFDQRLFDKRFLRYAINQNLSEYIRLAHGGAGLAHITKGKFESSEIPLPPLPEQRRIVAEIEKKFTRLDAAIASLRRVESNLKRYRASVLKSACEGTLVPTEAERVGRGLRTRRKDGGSGSPALPFETGEQLLQRILKHRRENWQGRGKYKEPAAPDTTNLHALPEGWCWASLPQLGELGRGKSMHRPRDDQELYGGPYPFIQTGDIRRSNGIVISHHQTYSEKGLAQSRLWPSGTLCITIAANIADTGILSYPSCFPDSIVGFVCEVEPVTTRFIEYFIRCEKDKLTQYAPATAQKNINLEVLRDVAIPLPPLAEQKRIVAEVERRLSVVDALSAQVATSLQRASRLRQSILQKAFAGELI